jgi:hypothetical protein
LPHDYGSFTAPAVAIEREVVRGVHEAVENGIGDCRIDDLLASVIDGELTGQDRRAASMAIVERFRAGH